MNMPLLILIPLLPFAGFLVNGLLGRRLPKAVVTLVALCAPLGSFLIVAQADFPSLERRLDSLPIIESRAVGNHRELE